jgi:hypothetical protein
MRDNIRITAFKNVLKVILMRSLRENKSEPVFILTIFALTSKDFSHNLM